VARALAELPAQSIGHVDAKITDEEDSRVDKLKQVIADALQVPVESVADDSSPASLPQWDSLAHLNLIMSLEQEFHVKFTIEEIVELENVPTIRRFLQDKKIA